MIKIHPVHVYHVSDNWSNMSTEKWKTVGSKSKSHSGKRETSAKTTKTSKRSKYKSHLDAYGVKITGQ